MKKAITFILVLLLCVSTTAQSNYSTLTGAKLLYNYFIDFIGGGTVGTSNYSAQTGQKKFQDQFIDFLKWADSVNTGLTSLQISDLTVTDTAYIDTLIANWAKITKLGGNIDANQKTISDLGTLKTDSVTSNSGNLKLSGYGSGIVEITDTLDVGTLISDTILVGITKLDENLDANQKMIVNLGALKTGKVDLKNQTAVESTIGTDTTRLYSYDDGSSVRMAVTKDDNATETTAILAELGDVANLATKAGSPSYWFDGSNDYIDLGSNPAALEFGTGVFTLLANAKLNSGDVRTNLLFYNRKPSPDYNGYSFLVNDVSHVGQLMFVCDGGAEHDQIISDKTYNDGKWHYVAGLRDGTNLKLFVDGIQAATPTTDNKRDITADANAYIGGISGFAESWAGEINRVLAFNLALTQDEIKDICQSGQIPYKYQGASQTAVETSDFSAGVDNYNNNLSKATQDGNQDGVSDGVTSKDNCLKIAVSDTRPSFGKSGGNFDSGKGLEFGKMFKLEMDYYIPNTSTGTQIKICDGSSSSIFGGEIQTLTKGTWTHLSLNTNIPSTSIPLYFDCIDFVASDTFYFVNIEITQIGCVLDLNPNGIGNTQWTDASGNNLNGAVSGAVANNLPPNHLDRYSTGTFTTNIASGVGTKVIVIPAYYYVESITIDDKGTAAGLSDIEATQETSSITLISGKSVATGNKLTFKTIADHNVYTVNKNLTFTATGNGGSGMEIIVNFRRQK